MQGLLLDIGVQVQGPTILFCDNNAALKLVAKPIVCERTKYIKVDCHFTRDKIQEKIITTRGIGTSKQHANIFIEILC